MGVFHWLFGDNEQEVTRNPQDGARVNTSKSYDDGKYQGECFS
jgi:hypothetical protein